MSTVNIPYLTEPDDIAKVVGLMWSTYNGQREEWLEEKEELRNFIFATDTTTTTNASLPWKNTTTLPKLCQIRDNLHANYLQALFPNDNWLSWEASTLDSATVKKKQAIESYISTKFRQDNSRIVVSQLLYDYIDYGNCFAKIRYVDERKQDPETNAMLSGYVGPRLVRISPLDIVFDSRAATFQDTNKVVRSVRTIGELEKEATKYPEDSEFCIAIAEAKKFRAAAGGYGESDYSKQVAFQMDGFGSWSEYVNSGLVEILTFEGDLYVEDTGELKEQRRVVVIDRSKVIVDEPLPTYSYGGTIRHAGWRLRPDNLWAMGPLDNLVGMQYRIDHLENLKADIFDLIAHPPLKVKGNVEDFDWAPLEEIYMDEDADVSFLNPDVQALNADFQIQLLESKMEEYAGAPREAMGMRTPGEKTAFEVQSLQNAAGRIFQEKISSFEVSLLEPLLNDMLQSAQRNMRTKDQVRTLGSGVQLNILKSLTPDDLSGNGKIRPMGARHFAEKAQLVQNLTQLFNSPIGQLITPDVDSEALAALIDDALGLAQYKLFKKDAAMYRAADSARVQAQLSTAVQEEQMPNEG